MKELTFWALIAASSVCAGIYGYHRFKLIRPDLYDPRYKPTLSESEREARIAEYQQKGDALSRAGAQPTLRKPRSGETCQNGFIISSGKTKSESDSLVIENGQPLRCDMSAAPAPQ